MYSVYITYLLELLIFPDNVTFVWIYIFRFSFMLRCKDLCCIWHFFSRISCTHILITVIPLYSLVKNELVSYIEHSHCE